ncbi:hypothetical protein [Occallatibacter savannae]|uniref:hypothetical protein n=1 Tax=Occallatibacter savannae TaxID=1002691 RepID=UPI000D68D923|nr:hypothetical protein [Occallatibacter savannae]
MGYLLSSTAEALRKTLQSLEDDPTVNTSDPAYVTLKADILKRILELEVAKAETKSRIHVVQVIEPRTTELAEAEAEGDSAIA